MRQGVEIYTLSTTFTGTVSTWPVLSFRAKFTASRHYRLVGVNLSATANSPAVQPTGIYLVVGQDSASITISEATPIVASMAGASGFYSQSIWLGFGDYQVDVPSGAPISLYASGTGTLGFPVFGLASFQLVAA